MNSQNKANLREIYERILDRHDRGYIQNIATIAGGQIIYQKKQLFYPAKVVKQLTGKSPKMLQKWIEWSKG